MRYVAIVGSREGVDRQAVVSFVHRLDPLTTTVVSGGAKGVDTWAAEAAEECGIPTVIIRPDWKKYGKSAGFKRNTDIVRAAHDVAAFWNMLSNGTLNTITKAIEAKKPCAVFNESGTLVEFFDPALAPKPPKLAVPRSR